jgi:hypothetical protein
VAATLAPFDFATGAALKTVSSCSARRPERDPVHFVLNILLFMPLGVLLHHEGRRRSIKRLPLLILAGWPVSPSA